VSAKKTAVFAALLLFFSCSGRKDAGIAFAEIPAGYYCLGQYKHYENPLRIVRSNAYSISTTEITNRQFSIFADETHYLSDAEKAKNAMTFHVGLGEFEWVEDTTANWRFPFGKKNGGIEQKMDHPVTCISFSDDDAYCRWDGVRLPTLDEWEIASRAGSTAGYFWGDDPGRINEFANIWTGKNHMAAAENEDHLYTAPVASYKPNAFGLYDVYGNVFEFCSGLTENAKQYKNVASSRGGSWWCSKRSCNFFNSADIGHVNIHASFSNQGFRVVKGN